MTTFFDFLKGVPASEPEPEVKTIRAVPVRAGVIWRTPAGDEYVRREDYEQAREALHKANEQLAAASFDLDVCRGRLCKLLDALP